MIAGSLGIPLNHLAERVSVPQRRGPLLVYCAGGYRSSIAVSLLQRTGLIKIAELAGGLAAWEAPHLPMVTCPSGVSIKKDPHRHAFCGSTNGMLI
jgi:rhodanese-related sulfurtransferase